MAAEVQHSSDAAILRRVIRPEQGDLNPEAARALLGFGFDSADIARMNLLAAKAREGSLTEAERIELDNYERVGHLLAIINSKARRSIQAASAKSP